MHEFDASYIQSCLFCRGKAHIRKDSFIGESFYYVVCDECLAQGPQCLDQEETIKKWNVFDIDRIDEEF